MIGLSLRSLRHRATAFTATFLSIVAGTALIASFTTLYESSLAPGVSGGDADTLFIMGAVVGGWGTVIVLFSLASTLGITVHQRAEEVATLRTIGATPRQVARMVRLETLLVALAGSLVGAGIGWLGGRGLLATLRDVDMVAGSVAYDAPTAPLASAALVVATSLLSATLASRRATRGPATIALSEGRSGAGRMRWWRVLAAVVLIGYGVVMGFVTVFVTADAEDPYEAMATSGSSSILVGVGLATLAPVLLRWAGAVLRPVVELAGTRGHLAGHNTTRRAHLLAGVLAPVIVLTSASIGTLMLVGIDNRTGGNAVNPDADLINMLNNVVVGMISLFAAIMVVNSFAAVVTHRRSELARLRLLGATPEQVRGSVLAEAGIVAVVGIGIGAVASLASFVPFAMARDEGMVPDGQLWLPPLLALGAAVVTLASAWLAVRRTTAGAQVALAGTSR